MEKRRQYIDVTSLSILASIPLTAFLSNIFSYKLNEERGDRKSKYLERVTLFVGSFFGLFGFALLTSFILVSIVDIFFAIPTIIIELMTIICIVLSFPLEMIGHLLFSITMEGKASSLSSLL